MVGSPLQADGVGGKGASEGVSSDATLRFLGEFTDPVLAALTVFKARDTVSLEMKSEAVEV